MTAPKTSQPAESNDVGWVHTLGEARHVRDESAARTAQSRTDDDAERRAASAGRWPAIVGRIRHLADAYNAGAGRTVLWVVEQSGRPMVTVAAGGEGAPSLTAELEGTLICIETRNGDGAPQTSEIRLRPDRDDQATAAYLLQNWMQRL